MFPLYIPYYLTLDAEGVIQRVKGVPITTRPHTVQDTGKDRFAVFSPKHLFEQIAHRTLGSHCIALNLGVKPGMLP